MKRILIGTLTSLVVGTGSGFALGIFVYPFWFLNDVAAEVLLPSDRRSIVAEAMFVHANPSDPIHWGKGNAKLYRDDGGVFLVHLEDSFQVGPGPKFHVYLADTKNIRSEADFEASKVIDLGRLRAFQGSQVYTAPANTAIDDYRSIVIWCKEFGVLISPADLTS